MSPIIVGPDPDYYQNISRRWGNALTAMTEVLAQKRAKEDRDLQRNLELLAKNPILADTLGNDLISKYGKKRPEIVSLVTTLQQQKKLQQESEQNLSKYQRAYAKEVGDRQRAAQGLEQMPDELQQPMDQFGTTVPIPNMTKQVLSSQIAMLPDPQWSAFAKMSDEDKYAVQVAMLRNDINPPTPPKNLGPQDLSDAMQGLIASGYAPWSPEGQTTARHQADLELSPAEKLKAQAAKDAAAAAQAGRLELQQGSLSNQEKMLQEREASQRRLIGERAANRAKKGTPEDKEAKKELRAIADYHINLYVDGSKEREQADAAGAPLPEPTVVTTYDRKVIKENVAKQVAKGADAEEASQITTDTYLGLKKEMGGPAAKKELDRMVEGFGVVQGGSSTTADNLDSLLAQAPDKIRQVAEEQLKTKSREEVLKLLMDSIQRKAPGALQPVR